MVARTGMRAGVVPPPGVGATLESGHRALIGAAQRHHERSTTSCGPSSCGTSAAGTRCGKRSLAPDRHIAPNLPDVALLEAPEEIQGLVARAVCSVCSRSRASRSSHRGARTSRAVDAPDDRDGTGPTVDCRLQPAWAPALGRPDLRLKSGGPRGPRNRLPVPAHPRRPTRGPTAAIRRPNRRLRQRGGARAGG